MATPGHDRPKYLGVFLTFARNSLVRDMTFRANFIIDTISSLSWVLMNLGFYILIFQYTDEIGQNTGWGKYQFFVFLATGLLINSLVQIFFLTNAEEFSELVRTGGLDFALLKPIDTQFLISLHKVEWSSFGNFLFACGLLVYSLWQLGGVPTIFQAMLYPIYVLCGVVLLYSLTVAMSSASVWLGRNQSLYDFWFYITNFSRYPMEIYKGTLGTPLQKVFTFVIPILIVVNVPAQLLAWPLKTENWWLALFAIVATVVSFVAARWTFLKALDSYRSASS